MGLDPVSLAAIYTTIQGTVASAANTYLGAISGQGALTTAASAGSAGAAGAGTAAAIKGTAAEGLNAGATSAGASKGALDASISAGTQAGTQAGLSASKAASLATTAAASAVPAALTPKPGGSAQPQLQTPGAADAGAAAAADRERRLRAPGRASSILNGSPLGIPSKPAGVKSIGVRSLLGG